MSSRVTPPARSRWPRSTAMIRSAWGFAALLLSPRHAPFVCGEWTSTHGSLVGSHCSPADCTPLTLPRRAWCHTHAFPCTMQITTHSCARSPALLSPLTRPSSPRCRCREVQRLSAAAGQEGRRRHRRSPRHAGCLPRHGHRESSSSDFRSHTFPNWLEGAAGKSALTG